MVHFIQTAQQDLIMKCDDESFQLLASFLSHFPKNAFCELYRAAEDVLSGSRKAYHFIYNQDSFHMDRFSTIIEMGDPTGSSGASYETGVFQRWMDRYIAEYRRVFGIDLRLITPEYCGFADDTPEPVIDPAFWPDSDDEAENLRRISAYNRRFSSAE